MMAAHDHVVHSRVEGEDEDHHEKKSVLKKVKAKAKKLKGTITGHGHHGHEEGHHTPDDHDLDEEDEDEEEVDDPEIHGAPIPKDKSNVTDPMRSNVPGLHGTTGLGATHNSGVASRTDTPGQRGVHFGETRHENDPVMPREKTNVVFSGAVSDFVPGQHHTNTGNDDLLGVARTKLAGPTTGPLLKHEEPKGSGGGTHAPHNTPVSSLPCGNYDPATMDVDRVKNSGSVPQSTSISSLVHGTHKGSKDVNPKQTFVSGYGGNSDQSRVNLDLPKGGLVEDPHAPKTRPQAYTPSNYETKVTDPTKSGGEEIGITPVLRSFDKMNLHGDDRQYLNNGANQNMSTGSHDQFSPEKPSNQGSSYTENISSATSAIAGKAISAKNAVASKLGYGGTESADQDDYFRGYVTGAGKSGSSPREHQNRVLDPSTNQFKPAETPQVRGTVQSDHITETDMKTSNQSGGTYTEKISSATSAIADKAISAKNVVASKLGYGASDQVHDNRDVDRSNVQSGSTAADQHGKTMTSIVAEKLTPVYGKVAGAGTAVMSKFQGGSTTSTGRDTSTGSPNQAGQDKGVSVKDYFVEKLRPGEEDRALSEVISEKLQIHKPGVKEQTGHSASAKPMGKVTESVQVRQHLGTTRNENFVVEKIKDTVGSMLGTNKNDEDTNEEDKRGVCVVEHRRLQEN